MLKRFILIALALCTLSSCDNSPPLPPAMSFKRFQPIYMSVSGIKVVEEYQSPMKLPNVEHTMPYSPADAMQIWVKDRLKAAGGERTMQVIIKDASVISKDGAKEPGFFDKFSVTSKEYNARLEVELRIYGPDAALSEASINVVATRMMKISPTLSASARDAQFYKMVSQMMDVMNAELEKNIYQHLGNYVNFSMTP